MEYEEHESVCRLNNKAVKLERVKCRDHDFVFDLHCHSYTNNRLDHLLLNCGIPVQHHLLYGSISGLHISQHAMHAGLGQRSRIVLVGYYSFTSCS